MNIWKPIIKVTWHSGQIFFVIFIPNSWKDRPDSKVHGAQVGPMLVPWTLLYGRLSIKTGRSTTSLGHLSCGKGLQRRVLQETPSHLVKAIWVCDAARATPLQIHAWALKPHLVRVFTVWRTPGFSGDQHIYWSSCNVWMILLSINPLPLPPPPPQAPPSPPPPLNIVMPYGDIEFGQHWFR